MSVYFDILTSAKNVLVNTFLPLTPSIKIRRKVAVLKDEPCNPLILVVPIRDTPESDRDGETFEFGLRMVYTVLVAIIIPNNQKLETDVGDLLHYRELIRQSLFVTELAGTPVYDCDIDLNPPFDMAALAINLDVSAIMFMFHTNELRNG